MRKINLACSGKTYFRERKVIKKIISKIDTLRFKELFEYDKALYKLNMDPFCFFYFLEGFDVYYKCVGEKMFLFSTLKDIDNYGNIFYITRVSRDLPKNTIITLLDRVYRQINELLSNTFEINNNKIISDFLKRHEINEK